MKVMRIVLYEGPDEAIEKQLAKSLKLGRHDLLTQINIVEFRDEAAIRKLASVAFLLQEGK